jgi:hypothetical protein
MLTQHLGVCFFGAALHNQEKSLALGVIASSLPLLSSSHHPFFLSTLCTLSHRYPFYSSPRCALSHRTPSTPLACRSCEQRMRSSRRRLRSSRHKTLSPTLGSAQRNAVLITTHAYSSRHFSPPTAGVEHILPPPSLPIHPPSHKHGHSDTQPVLHIFVLHEALSGQRVTFALRQVPRTFRPSLVPSPLHHKSSSHKGIRVRVVACVCSGPIFHALRACVCSYVHWVVHAYSHVDRIERSARMRAHVRLCACVGLLNCQVVC